MKYTWLICAILPAALFAGQRQISLTTDNNELPTGILLKIGQALAEDRIDEARGMSTNAAFKYPKSLKLNDFEFINKNETITIDTKVDDAIRDNSLDFVFLTATSHKKEQAYAFIKKDGKWLYANRSEVDIKKWQAWEDSRYQHDRSDKLKKLEQSQGYKFVTNKDEPSNIGLQTYLACIKLYNKGDKDGAYALMTPSLVQDIKKNNGPMWLKCDMGGEIPLKYKEKNIWDYGNKLQIEAAFLLSNGYSVGQLYLIKKDNKWVLAEVFEWKNTKAEKKLKK